MNNFQMLARAEVDPLLGEAIIEGYGLGVMHRVTTRAQGLATPILEEV